MKQSPIPSETCNCIYNDGACEKHTEESFGNPIQAEDQISLCRSCYCMTKTRYGKCGKCQADKSLPAEYKNTELRDWFTNLVFSGKSLAQINKMSKKELERFEVEYGKLQELFQNKYQEGELNGVRWTVAVVDDIHIKDHSGSSESDKTFKGIKNSIRDRFKFVSGVDPAPTYPVNVTLQSQLERKEQ